MARRNQLSEERTFKAVRLYLDDVQSIVAALRKLPEADGRESLTLTTDRWTCTSLEELQEAEGPNPVNRLTISDAPYVGRIEVRVWDLAVDVRANDVGAPAVRGVFEEVSSTVRGARRLLPIRIAGHPYLLGVLGGVAATATGSALFLGATGSWIASLGALGLAVVVGLWAAFGGRAVMSQAILQPREDRPSFLRRNRDQLVIALAAAGVGVIVTAVVTLALT